MTDKEPYGVVYLITNLVNSKKYVGITIQRPQRRWNEHIRVAIRVTSKPKCLINYAIAKYGPNSFKFEIIEECADHKSLNEAERRWIADLGCIGSGGYNLTPGGGGPRRESRDRMGRSQSGRRHPPEVRAKLSAAARGRKWTSIQRERYISTRKGSKMSEEQKEKLRQANLGKKHSRHGQAKVNNNYAMGGRRNRDPSR